MRLRILVIILVLLCYAVQLHADDRLSRYLYEDTKRLVKLVEDAATLVESQGTAAFAEFGRKGSYWFDDQCFLFVYDGAGTCIFHATISELVGKNLMDLRDMNGKPMVRFITDVCRKPQRDAHLWVFYLWQEKNEFEPKWKSAYVRKVVMPDGKECVIGTGHHFLNIEKVMVQEIVQSAADLLMTAGKQAAFKEFLNPTSRYSFLNTFIWVTDERGRALVDPAFPEQEGRDLTMFRDAMRAAIREYNAELTRQGLPPLAVGIGIHRGPGLVGLVGSRERMEYSFVGRTVNLAARVQALTRTHQVDILVTEAVRADLDTRFVLAPMPPELVKGIAEPVITYAVRECSAAPAPAAD